MSHHSPGQRFWLSSSRVLFSRRALVVIAATAFTAGFVWLWWQGVPTLYKTAGAGPAAENARISAVATTRAALLAGLVGIGALGTFWLNSRVYQITARTFELTERGHVTDRYTKAIEQLGEDNLDVRLGGIYSLEQIAHDSHRDRDRDTIVEVLSAFVRVHSDPLYQFRVSLPRDALPDSVAEQRRLALDYVSELNQTPVDVQAAVTVLGRLPAHVGVARAADLSGAWLTKADLSMLKLMNARFAGADLTEADLAGADLAGAFLGGANMTGAFLSGANMAEAILIQGNLTGARLDSANLTGARLDSANLTDARLNSAKLTLAMLSEADLSGARLDRADLSAASLDRANLAMASLFGTNLTGAMLREADLAGTTLDKAILIGARLAMSDGSQPSKYLTQEQIDVAHGDESTFLPGGLHHPHWWPSR